MRIGVDAACWANGRGYGRFTRELLRAMVAASPGDEFVCFIDAASAQSVDLRSRNVRVVAVPQSAAPTAAAAADGNRSPTDLWRFARAVWREPLDVFFSPSVYTYFPLPPGLPAVVTVHDAIADRFPALTLPSWRARLFWRLKVWLALRQSRVVLTVSDFAADEVHRVLGVPRERLRVAVEAPAAEYRPSSDAEVARAARAAGLAPGAEWFTYVGGFNPHKHVDLIVLAHAELVAAARAAHRAPPHLLLVGRRTGDVFHGGAQDVDRAIHTCGTSGFVHWTGFVPDRELRHLLTGTLALVMPSENEGFGLPAVEAAACGAPVVATVESPLPRLLDGGGVFVAPRDLPALTAAMQAMLDPERRRQWGDRGLAAARRLSWTSAARAALGAVHEAARARAGQLHEVVA